MFETAVQITSHRFAGVQPCTVFHREAAPAPKQHDISYRNRHILFRRSFSLEHLPQTAQLSLTADDYYKLYINGRFVTQGPAPGYDFNYYYNTVDVLPYLKNGENVIAVHTYYQGLINRVWVSGDLQHMFLCELDCDGEPLVVSDPSWKCAEHTGYTSTHTIGYETQFAEDYDSRAPEDGFWRFDYDDHAWGYAEKRALSSYTFVPQPTAQLEISLIAPRVIRRQVLDDGTSVIFGDLGLEAVGAVCLRAKGIPGSVVVIRCGEETQADGTVRYQTRCNCVYEETWTLSGRMDVLVPFDYKGMRYFSLHVPVGCTIADEDIQFRLRHYPYHAKLTCPTEDQSLRRIWTLCEDTIKYGVQEVYMDCPTREKGQYLGDGTVSSAAHLLLTGDGAMMKKALYEYARSTFISKGIMTVAPSSLMQEIADYSMQYPSQLLYYYRHTGDMETLRELYPYAKEMCDYFAAFDRGDGLLEQVDTWNLVDWPENLRDGYDFPLKKPVGTGCHNVINAFWYGCLCDMDRMRRLLGMPADDAYASRVAASFVQEFYDVEQHLFTDSGTTKHTAAHANVLPLYVGLDRYAGPEARDSIVAFLQRKGIGCMGVYMSYFLLTGLQKAGADDVVYELLTSPDGWMNMLHEGATTTFEAWGKDQKWNTSLFHPWAVAPILILGEHADCTI